MSGEQRAEFKAVRVESWKGIASFFQRDERTVKRWERERGLPVHRMPGERGGVFAYTDQLEIWLNSGGARAVGQLDQPRAGDLLMIEELTAPEEVYGASAISPDLVLPIGPEPPLVALEQKLPTIAETLPRSRRWLWLTAAAFILLAVGLSLWLSRRHHGKAQDDNATSEDARELYLTGKYFWTHRTQESLNHAQESFTQAIVHDPNYAPAYAGLAETYDLLPQYSSATMAEDLPKAIVAARKAIELDDSLAEAHRALGWALFFGGWNIKGAFAEFQRALALDPDDVEAHHWYGNSLVTLGRYEEGRRQLEAARRLEPSSSSIELDYANALYYTQDHQVALNEMLEIERLDENFLGTPRYMENLYLKDGNYAGYLTQLKLASSISHFPTEQNLAQRAEAGWLAGGSQGLLNELYAVQKEGFDSGRESGYILGMICVLLDRKTEADRYLRVSFDKRDPLAMSIASDAFYDRMKDDPAFMQLKSEVIAALQTD